MGITQQPIETQHVRGNDLKFGRFDDENREYVISVPNTPLPWINYLGVESMYGICSNTAGGYTFYKDARLRRITRYRYNNAPFDVGGRYLYLRDNSSGNFWSPSWQPVKTPLDSYECRHGLSYTKIASTYQEIAAETTYFIPLGETVEIWKTVLTNNRTTEADLSLFSSVEFCLWDAQDDATNFQRNFSTGQVEIEDGVIYHKTEYRERRDHFAYFACSEPLAGFDTQREAFLGSYRGFDNPAAVEEGKSRNSIAHGWSPHGSHHVKLQLAPGETKEIIFVLGYSENDPAHKFDPPQSQIINKKPVKQVIQKWLNPDSVEEGFDQLKQYWTGLLSVLEVHTPDTDTNRMVNIWNAYQCMVTFNMSRSTSFYESGIGRGMGFRDSNQDLFGFVHMIPEKAKERIIDIASTQLETGGAYHQYQPLTKRGNNDIGSGFNDDPLWLILGVASYVKESGDISILSTPVPYDNKVGSETTLYEHLVKSINYTLDRLGPHGLPLIGRADWNDCLNLNCFSTTPGEPFQTTENQSGGAAESVMIAGQFVSAAKEMADIANLLGNDTQSAEFTKRAEEMTAAVMEHAWDGEWFKRAYDFYSNPIGSSANEEGKIFIESQGICIMAGIGIASGHAARALDSVNRHLSTEHGIVVLQPAYSRYYPEYGEISSYPEGYKENAGIFCHTNPWIMISETMCGNGDRAFDYYKKINPSKREEISELHRCEPYVYAQMIAGKDAPTHGEAKNSWLSGTAALNFTAISQWILGIRPTYRGLTIDPVIPSEWSGFTATRKFRGAVYKITVEKEPGASGRVRELIVNGETVSGNTVPLANEGDTVTITAKIS